ncbi:CoA transferase subunit A [Geopsychrobacter electrodiphilus]|uniref:CoA transferase subunit A n=1 Tax=Geopsychrobacter electrodiphilus TaxID=225196 RepID=UPI0003768846|nr:CoA transferase subunit A [Geopsychrobacter electrodiphilus]
MISKLCDLTTALAHVRSGQTLMVGGFGAPGTPFTLIDALMAQGANELVLIKNEANEGGMGISLLIEAQRVRRIIISHLGLNSVVIGMKNRQEVEVEFYPQGILAEKIRAGGAGLIAILTDIGINTILRENKQVVMVAGREALLEPALRADVALLHAAVADRAGNLVYEKSARNFSPLMAMAADRVIVEAERIVEIGEIPADQIHTPAAFVDHVVELGTLTSAYGVLEHHVHHEL